MSWTTTNVTITDTGKRRTTSSSAEETDIVNSGSAVILYDVEVTFEIKALTSRPDSVGKLVNGSETKMYDYAEIDHIGITNPLWTIRGMLDQTNSADMQKIKQLIELTRTKGYKTLSGTLPDWVDGVSNGSTVNVRVMSFTPIMRANSSVIDFTLKLVQTA